MKTSIETSVIKTIISDSSASCLSVLVALTETLNKMKKLKPTDEIPTLKDIAKEYGLQKRTIEKNIIYLLNKKFLPAELIPSEWVVDFKGKLTKEIQDIINLVTEVANSTEQHESVNDDVIVSVGLVTDIKMVKKIYCLLPFLLSNHFLNEDIVGKLDKDWLTRPLDITRYKKQLKLNKELKKKQKEEAINDTATVTIQQELQQEQKIAVQEKAVDNNVIEVEAERVETELPEATKKRLNNNSNKADRHFDEGKKKLNRSNNRHGSNNRNGNYNRPYVR